MRVRAKKLRELGHHTGPYTDADAKVLKLHLALVFLPVRLPKLWHEFRAVVSDLPKVIRGVANNLVEVIVVAQQVCNRRESFEFVEDVLVKRAG